ncbi:hypothetical protein ASF41_02820 [Methylobacterium sp. Leaf111]|nr:hypothetical protein ASF41_02820 [Methylobacterium sp. Leaf111]
MLLDAEVLRDAFEAFPDPQFIVALRPGDEVRLEDWNAAARNPYDSADAMGRAFADLLPASQAALLRAGVERAATTGASLRIRSEAAGVEGQNAYEATFVPLRVTGAQADRRVMVSLHDLGPSRQVDSGPPGPDRHTGEAGSSALRGQGPIESDPDRPPTESASKRIGSDRRPAEAPPASVRADLMERRPADERVRESEARYRLLANYTSDLIVLDDVSGRHLYISPAVTSMLGYTVDEANRMGLRTLVHREDIANLSAILHALGLGQPTGSVIYRMRHRSGHDLWVEAAFRRIEEQGEIQVIQAIRDVTQRQRQEADLHSARIAAEAAVRAKAEFLATMSHELRTPLAGILGVHDLLQGDASLNRNQARLVGLAQEAGRSLLTIVNDILDVSKIEAGRLVIESPPSAWPG